jgi:hypothetical protein
VEVLGRARLTQGGTLALGVSAALGSQGQSIAVPLGHAKTAVAVTLKVQKDIDRGCNIVVPGPCFHAEASDMVG